MAFRGTSEAAHLSASELLGKLLGPAGEKLAKRYRDLRELASLHPLDLSEAGLSTGAVEKLQLILEVAKRYGETEWQPGEAFKGSHDVYAHYRERLAGETVEFFIAVLLDNKNRKIRDVIVGQGSLTASIVHPRDVYAQVIRAHAASVIFVHNHPSGDPTPSREDVEITRRLREIGELIGVRVLDHVVIGKGRYVSFVDDGYW